VNLRSNQLIEVEATVVLSWLDGESGTRRFHTLPLERNRINLFPTSWTVVHPIDDASPLFGLTEADLRLAQAEFIVLIKAFDDTFSQSIYQRTSYIATEVTWGVRFQPMATSGTDGRMAMDVNLVDATETVAP
jgi:inward rectifier potassium channel